MFSSRHLRHAALVLAIAGSLAACSKQGADPGKTAENPANAVPSTPWQQTKTPWGDPDLQGMWPIAHLIQTPFERPVQYGERTTFTEEEMAKQRASVEARNTRYANEDSQDRIGMGHWAEMSDIPHQTSLIVDPPNGRLPEMTELGKQMTAKLGTSWGHDAFDSPADFDTWDRCITRGLPPSMLPFNYNNGIQIVQSPGYVVINMEMIHEARIVPVSNMPAPDADIQQWLGASRGHWEGNTLVVETTNFNGQGNMTNFGTPGSPMQPRAQSAQTKITEKFTRTSEKDLTYTITVDDPVTQTRPWTAQLPWRLDNGYQFFEYACNEGNEAIRDFITTSRFKRAQDAKAVKK